MKETGVEKSNVPRVGPRYENVGEDIGTQAEVGGRELHEIKLLGALVEVAKRQK